MTKKQELTLINIIISEGGLGRDYLNFCRTKQYVIRIDPTKLVSTVRGYIELGYVDSRFIPTQLLTDYKNKLEAEIIQEDEEIAKKNEHFKNESKLTKWQVKSFWFVFTLALLGGIYSIYDMTQPKFNESEYYKKSDIDRLIKRLETKEKHENDLMEIHDLIYSNTTLINKNDNPRKSN